MSKKKRLPLLMADDVEVHNIDDLKAHFNISAIVKNFKEGKLLTWLEERYYDDEAEAVEEISSTDDNLEEKLCAVFGIEPPEEVVRRKERLNLLKKYTTDKNILENVDNVAFDQEDLADLLDEGVDEIYLCAGRFFIPHRMKNKTYIGVGGAVAVIGNNKSADLAKAGIKFKNVSIENDSKKISPKITAQPEEKPKNNQIKSSTRQSGHYEEITTIQNATGVHARPAAELVRQASLFESKIQLRANGKTVDGKSILMIMSLGLVYGTEITIVADGSDAQDAVMVLKNLIDSKFGEVRR